MAEDVDGNYYYDAGTVNEQFDNVEVVENSDGVLSIAVGSSEVRVEDLALTLTEQRAAPGTDELAQGENMIFVSDGSDSNTAPGDIAVARNPNGTVETNVLALASGFADA
jgi:hypothetical protein